MPQIAHEVRDRAHAETPAEVGDADDLRRHERRARIRRAAGAAVPCLAAGMLAVGCKAEYPVFDPHSIQRPEREAASTYKNYQLPPLPTTLQSTFLPPRNGERRPAG